MFPREPVRAHRETQMSQRLVCSTAVRVRRSVRPPGVGVEGGGLLVGARTNRWKLVFLRQSAFAWP